MRVRVRGIYATALTRVAIDAGHDVVQASTPIRKRFDATFGTGDHDVAVETTDDRQGVGVTGPAGDVADVVAACRVARDALAWRDPAPQGAVFDAEVTGTRGRGAVCALGDVDGPDEGATAERADGPTTPTTTATTEGFLPFDAADDYVEVGDRLRVQVREAAPPWGDRRPTLATTLRAEAGLATLTPGDGVTVDTRDDGAARELAGMTDLLDAAPPDGWGVRWAREAADADMSALSAALSRAADRARDVDEVRADPVGDPGRLVAPAATTWVWFGRESRFALDERRRAVTATMPGHHRTKAAADAASAGVDFVEAVCAPDGEGPFPFDAVTRQFGPTEGDVVAIGHGKPDGRLIVLGSGEVTDRDPDGAVTVRREMTAGGRYDALGTPREAGDVATTTFREGRWWYPTVYRDADGDRKGTYVNVCTPVEVFPDAVRYVDLHVDVVKHRDGAVERVDDDELDEAVDAGQVPEPLAEKARQVASSIEGAL